MSLLQFLINFWRSFEFLDVGLSESVGHHTIRLLGRSHSDAHYHPVPFALPAFICPRQDFHLDARKQCPTLVTVVGPQMVLKLGMLVGGGLIL